MFNIKNATINLFSYSKEIDSISAKYDDQDYETLKILGRGKNTKNMNFLVYNLKNITVYLS